MSLSEKKKIAVVGAGVAGVCAAYLLSKKYQVTLIEKNSYVGGHTNTRIVEQGPDAGVAVDTGFIVCNERNYPLFYEWMKRLGVQLRDAEMSFGFFSHENNLQYVGPAIKEFIKVPRNFLKYAFVKMIIEQQRFNRSLLRDLARGVLTECPLGEYLGKGGYSQYFVDHYLAPLIASIWSSPSCRTYDFPTLTFARFFNNHGMLNMRERPQWQTVVGGSHSYIKAFKNCFTGRMLTNAPVRHITREAQGCRVMFETGGEEYFDAVVLAAHADESLRILGDSDLKEQELLGAWSYSNNRAVLHTDRSVMAGDKRYWASWNYQRQLGRGEECPVAITYYMNKLQGLTTHDDYFVTLNPTSPINSQKVLYDVAYTHPIYTPSSIKTQDALRAYNGNRSTYFCGAYMGYGFHEDGVASAVEVARHFGCTL